MDTNSVNIRATGQLETENIAGRDIHIDNSNSLVGALSLVSELIKGDQITDVNILRAILSNQINLFERVFKNQQDIVKHYKEIVTTQNKKIEAQRLKAEDNEQRYLERFTKLANACKRDKLELEEKIHQLAESEKKKSEAISELVLKNSNLTEENNRLLTSLGIAKKN